MENLGLNMTNFWNNKNVLITGHTGFKGSWLWLLLEQLGANVRGISIHDSIGSSWIHSDFNRSESIRADIRDENLCMNIIKEFRPEFVFHLAAQPLVKVGIDDPKETAEINIIGTINLLNAMREVDSVKVAVIASSDKCYENLEWNHPYRENDRLGGADPYSASKAAMEIMVGAWRGSCNRRNMKIVTVRAGNVIGGGDSTEGRIISDIVTCWTKGDSLKIRNPLATRPYQWVLEPLIGYLKYAEKAFNEPNEAEIVPALNFGPLPTQVLSNNRLIELSQNQWRQYRDENLTVSLNEKHFKESMNLSLDPSMAYHYLGWSVKLSNEQMIEKTIGWYCFLLSALKLEGLTLEDWKIVHNENRDLELIKKIKTKMVTFTKEQITQYIKEFTC